MDSFGKLLFGFCHWRSDEVVLLPVEVHLATEGCCDCSLLLEGLGGRHQLVSILPIPVAGAVV